VALVDEGAALSRNVGKNLITLLHIPENLNPQGQIVVFPQSLSDFGDVLVIGKIFSRPYQAYMGKTKTTAFSR
jgi:hypothetical protein